MMSITLCIIQGLLNRNRGWGGSPFGAVFNRLLCLLIPTGCLFYIDTPIWQILLVLPFAYLGISVGHGRFFTLSRGPYPLREDNFPALLPCMLRIRRDNWLFDASALSVTGLCFVVPFAILYPAIPALILVVSGILKTFAYEIALLYNFDRTDDHIKEAELMAGVIYGIGFTSVLWIPSLL